MYKNSNTLTCFCLAALIGLFGCSKQTSSDGYTFQKKEWEKTNLNIEIVAHDSLADLHKVVPRATIKEAQNKNEAIQAFSIITNNKCQIHILNPLVQYKPEWIGHEVTHCIYGRWHQ